MDPPDTDLADDAPLSAQTALTALAATGTLGGSIAPVVPLGHTPMPPPEVPFAGDADTYPNGAPRNSPTRGPLYDNGVEISYPQQLSDDMFSELDDAALPNPVPLPYTASLGQRAQVHDPTPVENPLIVAPPIPGQEPGTVRTSQLPMSLTDAPGLTPSVPSASPSAHIRPHAQLDARDGFHQLPLATPPTTFVTPTPEVPSISTRVHVFINDNLVSNADPATITPAPNTVEALRIDMDRQMNISIAAHTARMESHVNASVATMEAASAKSIREYRAASANQPYDHNLIP